MDLFGESPKRRRRWLRAKRFWFLRRHACYGRTQIASDIAPTAKLMEIIRAGMKTIIG
jgi:hypothetical protein